MLDLPPQACFHKDFNIIRTPHIKTGVWRHRGRSFKIMWLVWESILLMRSSSSGKSHPCKMLRVCLKNHCSLALPFCVSFKWIDKFGTSGSNPSIPAVQRSWYSNHGGRGISYKKTRACSKTLRDTLLAKTIKLLKSNWITYRIEMHHLFWFRSNIVYCCEH